MNKRVEEAINGYISCNKNKEENEFLKEILNIKKLSNNEYLKLVKETQNGNETSKQKLIYYNLDLLLTIAYYSKEDNIDLLDLLQDEIFIFVEAIKKYNFNKNTNFRRWAFVYTETKIRRDKLSYTQIIPSDLYYLYKKYYKDKQKLEEKYNKELSMEEVLNEITLPCNYQNTFFTHFNKFDIFDSIEEHKRDIFYKIDEKVEESLLYYELLKLFKNSKLSNREIEVLIRLYGLNKHDKEKNCEIAKEFNLSYQRISEMHQKALYKLITSEYTPKFANYMEKPEIAIKNLTAKSEELKKFKKYSRKNV